MEEKAVSHFILVVVLSLLYFGGCSYEPGIRYCGNGTDDTGNELSDDDRDRPWIGYDGAFEGEDRDADLASDVKISEYDEIVRTYAEKYGFDWRLILAQIRQESEFKAHAVSPMGARGLMQLMPVTASGFARMKNYSLRDVYHDPRANIATGITYLRFLYDIFEDEKDPDRLWFALASYNCGLGHVLDAQEMARYLGLPTDRWDSIKVTLGKLTRRYSDLHMKVWGKPRPKHGFFYGYGETISYVENIKSYYRKYVELTSRNLAMPSQG